MVSLPYLRENTAKIRENKRKLASKLHRSADFRLSCLPPAQESAPGNWKHSRRVKGGRDLTKYCTPDTGEVIIVCSSTGV